MKVGIKEGIPTKRNRQGGSLPRLHIVRQSEPPRLGREKAAKRGDVGEEGQYHSHLLQEFGRRGKKRQKREGLISQDRKDNNKRRRKEEEPDLSFPKQPADRQTTDKFLLSMRGNWEPAVRTGGERVGLPKRKFARPDEIHRLFFRRPEECGVSTLGINHQKEKRGGGKPKAESRQSFDGTSKSRLSIQERIFPPMGLSVETGKGGKIFRESMAR